MERVWLHVEGCEDLIATLRRAAGGYEDLAHRVRAALAEVGEDSSEASEIDVVARWCDGLADDLRQRVEFVVWLDRSLAFSGLASIRGGVARGVLPLGGLPSHLDGEVPTTRAGFQAQAAERAGFDLAAYDPAEGFPANEGNVLAIYGYYLEIYETDERFLWAAMARLAGSSVFAGLQTSTPCRPRRSTRSRRRG